MSICKNCLITDAVPNIRIAADRLCNLCREHSTRIQQAHEATRRAHAEDLDFTLRTTRADGPYDCLLPLSGGKDSILLLHRLTKDYSLRVLAFTTDIGLPSIAWDNIRTALKKLDIDHLVYRPSDAFYRKIFRYLLRNQEARGAVYTVSYVYAPLFEGDAIRVAAEKRIPLVLAGYSPGQPDPERMEYEFSRELIERAQWLPPQIERSGEFSTEELSRFFSATEFPPGTAFPRYLAPFHAWHYSQEEVMRQVVELGLIRSKKNASPVFSNYPINWLLMYSDLKNLGYNPYLPEFSALIRAGQASRNYWRVMVPVVNTMIRRRLLLGRNVTHSLRSLGLTPDDLKITQPRGAYDPILAGD